MTQRTYLTDLCEDNKDAVIVGSLGTISYDLKKIEHPNKIILSGAMGSALSVGLGYALGAPHKKVIVVIGDGAFLMKMGGIATISALAPKNLEVIVIDNGYYASCGNQETNFDTVSGFINHYFCTVVRPRDPLAP